MITKQHYTKGLRVNLGKFLNTSFEKKAFFISGRVHTGPQPEHRSPPGFHQVLKRPKCEIRRECDGVGYLHAHIRLRDDLLSSFPVCMWRVASSFERANSMEQSTSWEANSR
jgi:hypothetical protein